MPWVFGEARDPNLWCGRLLREEKGGWLVQRGDEVVYIRRGLGFGTDEALSNPGTQAAWMQEFRHPEIQAPPEAAVVVRGEAGHRRVPGILGFLTIKLHGDVISKGTEEEGINIKQHGADLVTGGTGTITVKEQDA